MEDLSKIVALVTGGGQGIGKAFVESLLSVGAKVTIGDLTNSQGSATQRDLHSKYPGKIIFTPCNVTNAADIEAAIKTTINSFGTINLIINNAGVAYEIGDKWKEMITVNVEGVVSGTKLGFKYMSKENGGAGGTVINVASIAALGPLDIFPVYGSTKAFINYYSKTMGLPFHYDPSGVSVMAVNPGMTSTPIIKNSVDDITGGDERRVKRLQHIHHTMIAQSPEHMGKELLSVLSKGESGSQWLIENNEPAKQLEFQVIFK